MATSTSDTSFPSLSGADIDQHVDKVASSAHGALHKVEAAADDATSAVRPLISRAANVAHQKVDDVAAAVKPAATWVAEKNAALATAGRNAEADTRQYIVTHPWHSVVAAAGIGYLLGRLAGRR